jgi:hypothetical protein
MAAERRILPTTPERKGCAYGWAQAQVDFFMSCNSWGRSCSSGERSWRATQIVTFDEQPLQRPPAPPPVATESVPDIVG